MKMRMKTKATSRLCAGIFTKYITRGSYEAHEALLQHDCQRTCGSSGFSFTCTAPCTTHTHLRYNGSSPTPFNRYPGSTFVNLQRHKHDPGYKMLVLLGEIGGIEEYISQVQISTG
ncbi:hypothetical protein M378DRAFT_651033 [Amanita muscaria Koide BX008]|uniref:Uncharacterized protein n=1 Tax=Amanita muscaria (strain Koide BX008) TaxID=946122 RepID=A0A0C2X543_AMAMK|nr:hypothetical protein M378DRAFT_651033 [Amanita muscaria Koide BX008]